MVERLLYWIYLVEWHLSHRGPGFKGCSPACYCEWHDCELKDMLRHPDWYKGNWYYFMIEHLRDKISKTL